MKGIKKKKTVEKEDPAVEHFRSVLARIAMQAAGRCEHEESILNEKVNKFGQGDRD